MPAPIDYTGQTFGKLTAVRYTGKHHKQSGRRLWEYRCACGNVAELDARKVVLGETKSCGCSRSKRSQLESLQWAVFTGSRYTDGNMTFEDFLHYSQEPCYWCGLWRPSKRVHRFNRGLAWEYQGLDRLDNARPHDLDNVVPCCWTCNEHRGNATLSEWMGLIERVYRNRVAGLTEPLV